MKNTTSNLNDLSEEYRQYLLNYFYILKTELNSLELGSLGEEKKQKLLNTVESINLFNITLGSIFEIENIIISLMPAPRLMSKIWYWRKEFQKYALPQSYKAYIEASPIKTNDESKSIDIEILKADLYSLLFATQMAQVNFIAREKNRNYISLNTLLFLALMSALWICIFIGFIIINYQKICQNNISCYLPPFYLNSSILTLGICFFGFLGGLISSLSRLNQSSEEYLPTRTSPKFGNFDLSLLRLFTGVFLAGFSGMIFALILFFMFKGNLFQSIFSEELTSTAFPFGNNSNPQYDFYLVLVWSFAAGFCEKLIPDSLFFLLSKRIPQKENNTIHTNE